MHTNGSPLDILPLLPPAANGSGPRLTREEVMTAAEVAELLHLPVSTVYELARRGELPARRLGRTWRFLRPRLEELLDG
jgi:excisionase family DNA binding protein